MEEFYKRLMLVGEDKNNNYIFIVVDEINCTFELVKTEKRKINLEQFKKDFSNLESEQKDTVFFNMEDGGIYDIIECPEFGDKVLSAMYDEFLLYIPQQMEWEIVLIEKNDSEFLIGDFCKYYNKERFNNLTIAKKTKDKKYFEKEINDNCVFDDLESFDRNDNIEQVEKNTINSKENLFKIFCEFLDSRNIKF